MADAYRKRLVWNFVPPDFNGSIKTFALDAATDKIASIFQVERAITITRLAFAIASKSGTVPEYKSSLQGVDFTVGPSIPDGTIKGGGTPASVLFTPAGTYPDLEILTLDNAYAAAQGEWIALPVEYSSGTIDAGNSITARHGLQAAFSHELPKVLTNTGTWALDTSTFPLFAYGSADAWYGAPIHDITTRSEATTGNRIAMKFSLPVGHGDTYKVLGALIKGRLTSGANATAIVGLWNAAGTLLQGVELSTNAGAGSTAQHKNKPIIFDDAPLATLTHGTVYYLGVEHDGSTSLFTNVLKFKDSATRQGFVQQSDVHLATWNGTAWTDIETEVWEDFELILEDITEPAGGGGLLVHPGMSGGMRG